MKALRYIISLAATAIIAISNAKAQSDKVYHPMVHTLQTIVNDNWLLDDVITLNSEDWVTISFDHLSHDYHRFIYKITHCNADWSTSDLFEIDYMDGFNGLPIEDYTNSFNTTMLYTHYRLELPNDDIQFKVSGNYKVEIFLDEDDNDTTSEEVSTSAVHFPTDEPIAVACFRIVEPCIALHSEVTTNTDIDTNLSHQQVSFSINYNGYNVVNPATEFKPYVYQNSRTDNYRHNLKPTYTTPGQVDYSHNLQLIFPAGNEYRRFEIINMHYATQGVDKISYYAPYFHAELYPDSPRRNYSYDEDHNGRYLIRYNLAEDNDTEADYLFTHFRLDMPRLQGGQFYLSGEFTYNDFTPAYQATYNEEAQAYEATVLLKQGAYDFIYLWVPDDSGIGQTAQAEGNFYESNNEYQIYIYHRPFGGRYDKLVATQQIKVR